MKNAKWTALSLTLALSCASGAGSAFAESISKNAQAASDSQAVSDSQDAEKAAETESEAEAAEKEKSAAADAADSSSAKKRPADKKSREKGRKGKDSEEVEAPENAIGKEAAIEKALAETGIEKEEAGKIKVRLSKLTNGTIVYKVSFTVKDLKYSCQIDAVSAKLLDKSTKAADEQSPEADEGRRKKKADAAGDKEGVDAVSQANEVQKADGI